MFNASRITNWLWIGAEIAGPDELDFLRDQGVRAILSVAQGLNDESLTDVHKFETLYIPWLDDGTPKDAADFTKALDWWTHRVKLAIEGGKRFPGVLVHCASGVNRGPMMGTYLLAAMSGLPTDEAWKIVKGMRPAVTALDIPQYRSSVVRALLEIMPVVPTDQPGTNSGAEITLSLARKRISGESPVDVAAIKAEIKGEQDDEALANAIQAKADRDAQVTKDVQAAKKG